MAEATFNAAALDDLLGLLDVQPASATASTSVATTISTTTNTAFVGRPAGHDAIALYGGHLLGQAVTAACKTVSGERHIHSLHSYFLLPGNGLSPIDYEVQTVREGRSFCTRRVLATQNEGTAADTAESGGSPKSPAEVRQIFDLTASFHKPEQFRFAPMSVAAPVGLADPETLPTFQECIAELGPIFGEHWSYYPRPVDYRLARAPYVAAGASERQGINFWFRVQRRLPDDPALHAAVLAYISDDCLADNVGVPYGITAGNENIMMVSLDHAMWFHRPVRVDEWVYIEQWPVVAAGARGTVEARFWQDGRLIATAVQEALARF